MILSFFLRYLEGIKDKRKGVIAQHCPSFIISTHPSALLTMSGYLPAPRTYTIENTWWQGLYGGYDARRDRWCRRLKWICVLSERVAMMTEKFEREKAGDRCWPY